MLNQIFKSVNLIQKKTHLACVMSLYELNFENAIVSWTVGPLLIKMSGGSGCKYNNLFISILIVRYQAL